jgi:hypothetical protein
MIGSLSKFQHIAPIDVQVVVSSGQSGASVGAAAQSLRIKVSPAVLKYHPDIANQ